MESASHQTSHESSDELIGSVPARIPEDVLDTLRDTLFQDDNAGERCLLDHPVVRETALALKRELTSTGHLPADAVAIQAIAFNKTAITTGKSPGTRT